MIKAAIKAIREEYYRDIIAFLGPFVTVGVMVAICYATGGYNSKTDLEEAIIDNKTIEVAKADEQ